MVTLTANEGFITPEIPFDDFNSHAFVINQILAQVQTATLVEIVAVTNAGERSPVGFVDVRPMVAQVDNAGNPTEHVIIYKVPYMRMQGGNNAIILDPKVGDKGIAVFASRDITHVKNTRKKAGPASFRKFSYADGLYVGGTLNGAPTQYVQFNQQGISIVSPTAVKLVAPSVEIHAGERFTWDVAGFGEMWKHAGGTTWLHETWQDGAHVDHVHRNIDPPDGTPT